MPQSYLIRHHGRHYLAQPGAAPYPSDDDETEHDRLTIHLCWVERDTGVILCRAGDEDEVLRPLEDDDPDPTYPSHAEWAAAKKKTPADFASWAMSRAARTSSDYHGLEVVNSDSHVSRSLLRRKMSELGLRDFGGWLAALLDGDAPPRPEGEGWERWEYLQDRTVPAAQDARVQVVQRNGLRCGPMAVDNLDWRQRVGSLSRGNEIVWWRIAPC